MSNYSPLEEKLNIYTHGFGFVLSCIALLLLSLREVTSSSSYLFGDGKLLTRMGLIIFGLSLCMLYAASTLYHASKNPKRRKRLKIFDHAAIYVLIAGTYTPFTLITLDTSIGYILFLVVWGIALAGIFLKLFFTGKFDALSTILYVAMGWIIVFAYESLGENLAMPGIWWLIGGGISYTIGAVLYSLSKLTFNHAIFHVFVLIGSICHFIAIYEYVGLPH